MAVADASGANFDFERVFSRTSGLVARNFVPFFALSFLLTGLPYAAILFVQPSFQGDDPTSAILLAGAVNIVSMAFGLLLQGTLTRASIDELSGKKLDLGNALSTGLAVMLPLLGLGLLIGMGVAVGFLLLIVPGFMLLVRWSVAAPVLMAEKAGILAAMGRSAVLTKGHRWAIFGLFLILIVVALVVSAVVGGLVGGGIFAFAQAPGEVPPVLFVAVMTLVQAAVTMVSTVVVCAVYFELRQIKDGVGITEIASVFD
jgi:Membrane domain of glycerophosphoryl diester phosphodiesterase